MSEARSIPPTAAVAVVAVVAQVPFLERGIVPLDEGHVLAIADALAGGETLYRDRITLVGPLTFELVGALLRLFGSHVLVGRILQLAVFAACVLLGFQVLRRVAGPRAAVLGALAVLAIKPLGFAFGTIVNYSQLAQALGLLVLLWMLRFLEAQRLAWLFAAGVAAGFVLLAKQNLGLFVGLAAGLTVVGDWLYARGTPPELLRRGAVLFAGSCAPLLLAAGYYAARGAFDGLVQHTVVDLAHFEGDFEIALPPLGAWSGRDEPMLLAIRYAPGPVTLLLFERVLSLGSRPLALAVELFAKLAYYGPVLALLGIAGVLLRSLPRKLPRAEWSALLLVGLFGATAFASILYRADWTHLTNVYPALLLPCFVLGARWSAGAVARAAGLGLLALWLGVAFAVGAVVMTGWDTPLETPRGRLLGPAQIVDGSEPVVRYLEARPADETVAVLPSSPLFYFLAGRRVPLSYDLFLPGMNGPGADGLTARELAGVERVVFDPRRLFFVYTSMPDYGPETAAALARDFRIERSLSRDAYELVRRPPAASEQTVVDVWDRLADEGLTARPGPRFAPPSPTDASARALEHWAFYRAVVLPVHNRQTSACARFEHTPQREQVLSLLPMFAPREWEMKRPVQGRSDRARFRVAVLADGERSELYREEKAAGLPGDTVRLPLAAFAGRPVEIELCTELPRRRGAVRVGFAEVRVLAPVAGAPEHAR